MEGRGGRGNDGLGRYILYYTAVEEENFSWLGVGVGVG